MMQGFLDTGNAFVSPQVHRAMARVLIVKDQLGKSLRTRVIYQGPRPQWGVSFEYDLQHAYSELFGMLTHDYNLCVMDSSYHELVFQDFTR